jgi:gliding motility-associated-like protein/uncharacterized repeat protein (TIGR01451 family)
MKYGCRIIYICIFFLLGTTIAFSKVSSSSLLQPITINAGTTITLHGATNNAAAYQWYMNGVKIPGAVQKDYTTGVAGIYTVFAFNTEGCPSPQSDAVQILVAPGPTPPITPDTLVDLKIQIKSTNTQAVLGDNLQYVLTVSNQSGLTGTDIEVRFPMPPGINFLFANPVIQGAAEYDPTTNTMVWKIPKLDSAGSINIAVTVRVNQIGPIQSTAYVSGKEKDPVLANNVATTDQQINGLKVPNVFTPNGDGLNDTFIIPGLSAYTENQIDIINRWGSTIYQKKNYNNEWTGDGLLDGTYFYVLKAKNSSGGWETYKGYITLLRSRM